MCKLRTQQKNFDQLLLSIHLNVFMCIFLQNCVTCVMHVSRVWTARLVSLLSTYRYVNWTVCLETSKIFGFNTWALKVAHHIENSYYYESTQVFFNIFEKTQRPKKLNDFSGQNSTNWQQKQSHEFQNSFYFQHFCCM